jgi:hypothetical protein
MHRLAFHPGILITADLSREYHAVIHGTIQVDDIRTITISRASRQWRRSPDIRPMRRWSNNNDHVFSYTPDMIIVPIQFPHVSRQAMVTFRGSQGFEVD